MQLTLEFGGGAELLVGNVRKHQVALPAQEKPWTLGGLLPWIRDNLVKQRPELFMQVRHAVMCSYCEVSDGRGKPWTLGGLLPWIRDNLVKQRPELFM